MTAKIITTSKLITFRQALAILANINVSYGIFDEYSFATLVKKRIIARLATYFQIEHPQFLGDELVPIHTQLCSLCDLLIVSYNIVTGNTARPHAIKHIRG